MRWLNYFIFLISSQLITHCGSFVQILFNFQFNLITLKIQILILIIILKISTYSSNHLVNPAPPSPSSQASSAAVPLFAPRALLPLPLPMPPNRFGPMPPPIIESSYGYKPNKYEDDFHKSFFGDKDRFGMSLILKG